MSSEFKVEHFYGLYPSSTYGNLLLLDPLLPPKKCLVDCITCPLKKNRATEMSTSIKEPSFIIDNLKERLPTGIEINGVLLWGFGDPLLLSNIYEITLSLRTFLSLQGINCKLYVHTSFLKLLDVFDASSKNYSYGATEPLIELIDGFVIPFLWYGAEKYLLGWPRNKNFSGYLELLKNFFENNRDKLIVELHLFRVHEISYPERLYIDEVVALLRYIKAEKLVLKFIDRPTANPRVRPISESYVEHLREYLTEEGFKISVDRHLLLPIPPQWKKTAIVLYNHILRIPLKYAEVRAMYGDLGIIALNNLISKNLVTRITWGGDIYFVSRDGLTYFP